MTDAKQRPTKESRGLILRLALRAIRWRAAASATVFVVAAITVLSATVGPIYLHAVEQTVLARHIRNAAPYAREVLISRNTELGYPGVRWNAQVERLAGEVTSGHLLARPTFEQQAIVDYGGPAQLKAEIVAVGQACAHLRIVSGRCVSGNATDDTVISTTTAKAEHLAVGGTLVTTTTTGEVIRLHIVGIYRPIAPDGPFWTPWGLFQYGGPGGPNEAPPGDASFVSAAALSSRVSKVLETVAANAPLAAQRVTYDDIGPLRLTLAQLNAAVAHLTDRSSETGTSVASVSTGLTTILNAATHETSIARTLVTLATVQLALLAVFLLYAVVANMTAAQEPEVALAKLRGRRGGSILLQSVAQPMVLVVAAAPAGALLAWLLVWILSRPLLGGSVDVVFPPAAFAVAALTVVGGVLAAIVATRRIVVTPVGTMMRSGAEPAGGSIGLLLADAAAVTMAVAGLVELKAGGVLNSGKPNPLSIVAPTLLAVAAGVVALRLLPFFARRLARATRDSGWLATFLTVRQLLRRPAEARPVLLVAVAVSIAVFAITLWSDSRHNRSARALNTAGANTVLYVRLGAGVNLTTAVDRADPSGNSMAAAYTNVDRITPLLAVDTARFAGVGAWVSNNSSIPVQSVLRRLSAGPPPVVVAGTRLRLNVGLTRPPAQGVRIVLHVTLPNHRQAGRVAGPVTRTRGSVYITLPPECGAGCRVAALQLTANGGSSSTGLTKILAMIRAAVQVHGHWRPVAGFGDPGRWRGNGQGPLAIIAVNGALSLNVGGSSGVAWPSAVSASIPTSVPAVVGSDVAATQRGDAIHSIEAVGLDRSAVFVNGATRAVTLPQIDRGGVMVGLGNALAAMKRPSAKVTHYQVWLSLDAPRNIAARLAGQHVYVQRTVRAATYRAVLDHSGPAFADSLFLLSALAATLLAIAATAVGRVLSIRRRSYELAALEAVGVAPRTLRRATAAEQSSVFAIGLIIGLAAGVAGSALALPSTPVFVNASIGPPLILGLPWLLLAALTLGMVFVFALASMMIARLVERVASPSQLRGAQQ